LNFTFVIALLFLSLLIPALVNAEITCPNGSFERTDENGNIICLDNTKRFPVEPIVTPDEIQITDEQSGYVIIGVIIFIIIIAVIAKASQRKTTAELGEYRDVQRMPFSNSIKEEVKEKQNGRCVICEKIPTHWEFDHVNGRGDNSINNCQGLCRDCHQDKTLKDNW